MKYATPGEYFALVIASLVLIVVLVASYMCIQLYDLRKPQPCSNGGSGLTEGFLSAVYSPSCGSEWAGRRRHECRGITTGAMPSIETTAKSGHGVCGGRLGVPP